MEGPCFCLKGKKEYKILMFSFLNSKPKSDLGIFFIFLFNRQCEDMVTQVQMAEQEIY